jgi:hypothetical protein
MDYKVKYQITFHHMHGRTEFVNDTNLVLQKKMRRSLCTNTNTVTIHSRTFLMDSREIKNENLRLMRL